MVKKQAILVGGGLAGCLLAYRLAQVRPEIAVTIIEAGEIGGNHTWCFHHGDLSHEQRSWLAPFVLRSWDACSVRFPDHARTLPLGYVAITAERLRAAMKAGFKGEVIRARADRVDAEEVACGGKVMRAPLVVDGRGALARPDWALAWQAFVGLQVELASPHGLEAPVIMDAAIPQEGGYRFIYTLPFSPTGILVEDTRYQEGATLQPDRMHAEILSYIGAQGWCLKAVLREESGVLPIVLSGQPPFAEDGPVPIGMRAGLFHPVTGYSLPDAVRLADAIAAAPELTTRALRPMVADRVRRQWRRHGFYRLLNRMLFMAGPAEERWRILSRFYRLPAPLIGRFYAGETGAGDMLRILSGRPPVPLRGALACLFPSSARSFSRQAAA